MTDATYLLVCDDRGARGALCDLVEGTGARCEEASSRYDLAAIVEEESCVGAFVALNGLKKDVIELLATIDEEAPASPSPSSAPAPPRAT